MIEIIEADEWKLLRGIQNMCERFITYDYRYNHEGPISEAYTGRLLEMYMSTMYKAATDPTICRALKIESCKVSPEELLMAMYRWVCNFFLCEEKTVDGVILLKAALSLEETKWHPVPFVFKEKWADYVSEKNESLEFYMADFIDGIYSFQAD